LPTPKYHTLSDLIAEGEHQRQDFKYEISSISKIAHSVSAFANTDGGRLLVGVKDNGKIAGVRTEEEIYMIEAAASSYCIPPAECRMETVKAEGKTVLIATISKSDSRPIRAKEQDGTKVAYVRIDDENIVASPVHLALWKKQSDNMSFSGFSEKQSKYLKIIGENPSGMTLNQFQKKAILPRPKAVEFLASCVRFEIVEMVFSDHKFYFRTID